MSRYHSYIRSASDILDRYQGAEPLARFLAGYYRQRKQIGGRDRKLISQLCYGYFRLGHAFDTASREERLGLGAWLSGWQERELLEILFPVLLSFPGSFRNRQEQLQFLRKELPSFRPQALFPFLDHIGSSIDPEALSLSLLDQPDLFIRLRPGHEGQVKRKLGSAGIPFLEQSAHCLALPNASSLEKIIQIDEEAVIQDYNSQRVGEWMAKMGASISSRPIRIWDCCAASGGKSILAWDILEKPELTVSDVRQSILDNLRARFQRAHITGYHCQLLDLSKQTLPASRGLFDCILADVPCTGSGTWGRTPEQAYFFDPAVIAEYSRLQRQILRHALASLAPGGYLLYSTCSVFREENEEIVSFLGEECGLRLVGGGYLIGYQDKADTLFAALFTAS